MTSYSDQSLHLSPFRFFMTCLKVVLSLPCFKGQLISKWLFCVFKFFQKMKQNKSTWVVKLNFFVRFLEELRILKSPFEINWPLVHIIFSGFVAKLKDKCFFESGVIWFVMADPTCLQLLILIRPNSDCYYFVIL